MKKNICSFIVGFIFAIGLGVSGMTQPQKVVAFLDLFGSFDPSLIFVMGGAIGVHFVTYRLIRKRKFPLLHSEWLVPTKKDITPALMIGSFIFGVGWALGGFCPGPALTSLASFEVRPLIFVGSMLCGILLFRWVDLYLKLQK
ncbi:MAG: YeeE/YedE family protein [Bacteriovorax sp.]|nr:YeeE/YedE family protein [Bacteriovorax sp.]